MKLALRQLAKSPGFTVVAVLSLALGLGANTAVFSVMNGVLLQMLPVKNPHELVLFNWLAEENVSPPSSSGWSQREAGTSKFTSTSFSIPTYEALKQTDALAEMFAFAPVSGINVQIEGLAEVASAQVASGNYHQGLGVTAAAGRLFEPGDDVPGAEPVAVISYRYWQRRFGGEASAIGKSVVINRVPTTIIGVTVPSFNGALQVGEVVDVTLPLALEARFTHRAGDNRDPNYWWVRIMGRMKPGAVAGQVRANLEGSFNESIRGHVRRQTLPGAPAVDPNDVPLPHLRVEPGGQGLSEARRSYERSLHLLSGVVALVLLVACANIANLLLARGTARRREIAVRLALGASRGRIVRQLLAESTLLAGLGALAGLVLSIWGARALIAMSPFGSSMLQIDTRIDWRVLGFATVAALVTSVVFGLAPALRATRVDLTSEFQGGTRTLGAGSRSLLAKSLMVVQVALSLVLLVGAGLFIRTLHNLQNVDVGFNRERLLLFQVNAAANGADGPQSLALYVRLRDRLAALAGVRRATFARTALLSQSNWTSSVTVPGYVQTAMHESVSMNGVEQDYLATLEIPLLRGRNFDERDHASGPKVAIVNQTFAKKYFGTEDVVGRRFSTSRAPANPDIEIIGLIRDTRYSHVKTAIPSVALRPFSQVSATAPSSAHFLLRFTGGEAALTTAVRAATREIDPGLPITNLRTQQEQIDRLFAQERLFAQLCSVFGLLALLLAAVGLYGLMSYAVLRRTGEIGLRMALGALPRQVVAMIVQESFVLVGLGILIGGAAAWGATRWISSMLFGLSSADPATYGTVAVLLLLVSLAACLLPSRRAARVEPIKALRAE